VSAARRFASLGGALDGVDFASGRAFRIMEWTGGASQQSFSSWEIVLRIVE